MVFCFCHREERSDPVVSEAWITSSVAMTGHKIVFRISSHTPAVQERFTYPPIVFTCVKLSVSDRSAVAISSAMIFGDFQRVIARVKTPKQYSQCSGFGGADRVGENRISP